MAVDFFLKFSILAPVLSLFYCNFHRLYICRLSTVLTTQTHVGNASQRFQPGDALWTIPRHPENEFSEWERSCQWVNYGVIRVWHLDLLLVVRSGAEASVAVWPYWKK